MKWVSSKITHLDHTVKIREGLGERAIADIFILNPSPVLILDFYLVGQDRRKVCNWFSEGYLNVVANETKSRSIWLRRYLRGKDRANIREWSLSVFVNCSNFEVVGVSTTQASAFQEEQGRSILNGHPIREPTIIPLKLISRDGHALTSLG